MPSPMCSRIRRSCAVSEASAGSSSGPLRSRSRTCLVTAGSSVDWPPGTRPHDLVVVEEEHPDLRTGLVGHRHGTTVTVRGPEAAGSEGLVPEDLGPTQWAGTRHVTVVPSPGAESTSQLPPSISARSVTLR